MNLVFSSIKFCQCKFDEGDIWMGEGGGGKGVHGKFSLKLSVFSGDLLQNYKVRLRYHSLQA